MIIMVRLMGGLGNQMFQYAFGRSLSLRYNCELVLDTSLLEDRQLPHNIVTHRDFELGVFKNLSYRFPTGSELRLFNAKQNETIAFKIYRKLLTLLKPSSVLCEVGNEGLPSKFTLKSSTCFVGRWQSYKHFERYESIIRNDFRLAPPNVHGLEKMLEAIKSSNSVCLHVRRGDLVTSPLYSKTHGTVPIGYYEEAVKYISAKVEHPSFYVFSDDERWCIENIKIDRTTVVPTSLSGPKAIGHFFLMLHCKHFIISNSTFAWWAAYLGGDSKKIVTYPSRWYRDESKKHNDLCPPAWVKI